MTMHRLSFLAGIVSVSLALAQQPPPQGAPPAPGGGQAQGGRGGQGQARDRAVLPQGTASIAGRVITADSGRPVKRASVTVSGGGRGGRTTVTDDQGRYHIAQLGAGTYSVSASKNGFVDAIYGQRRPLQAGTPVALVDAQASNNIDLRLTRGGVITGHVHDEDGEPLARALVTVQRYQYVRGERQMTPAGGDQTDDRGQYRAFGLPPGDYYVSVSAAGLSQLIGRGMQQLAAGIGALGGRGGGRGAPAGIGGDLLGPLGGATDAEPTGYAPTYYPGVVSAAEAGKITVGPGQEVSGADFQIQLVPLATVSGIVVGADAVVAVMLMAEDAGGRGPLGGPTLSGRSQSDGTFTVSNVPPGRYVAVARSGGGREGGAPKTGMQSIAVNGQSLEGVTLALQPPLTLSGNITVESSGTAAPADYSGFRIDVPDVTPLPFGGGGGGRGGPLGGGGGRAEKNGSFQIGNLLPGRHYIRLAGAPQAPSQWTLKAVMLNGQDVTDQAVDLKPGQDVDNVAIVLTDRATEISGTVRDNKNAPIAALTVIAFAADQQFWRPQSRHITTSRTDAGGAFRLGALPPGDYFLIATDNVEQGEWFDPAYLEQAKAGGTRLTLGEGEKKVQDLTLKI